MRSFLQDLLILALAALPLAAQDGYLITKVGPGRAGVFVDGKYVGPAGNFGKARKYALPAGSHEVKLVDPRYEPLVTKVDIVAGKKSELVQTLKRLPDPKPPFGRIRVVHAEKFAAVYINGQYVGHADEFSNVSQGLLLNPGEYIVEVVPFSGTPVKQTVKVEADKTVIVK